MTRTNVKKNILFYLMVLQPFGTSACVGFKEPIFESSESAYDSRLIGAWSAFDEELEGDIFVHIGKYEEAEPNAHIVVHSKEKKTSSDSFNMYTGILDNQRYILSKFSEPPSHKIEYHGYQMAKYRFDKNGALVVNLIDGCEIEKAIKSKQLLGSITYRGRYVMGNMYTPELKTCEISSRKGTNSCFPRRSFSAV